jgi:hypothetical protein
MKKSIKGILCVAVAAAALATVAQADDLLIIDLSVENQVTVTATDGLSAVDVTGSDSTGAYFENFYGVAGSSLSATLVSGDFSNTGHVPDNSPALYRSGSGSDPGLNIYSWTDDSDVTFTTGTVAFTGAGTWDLDANEYAEMLAGATRGNIYFPADDAGDIPNAQLLGTYLVIPEPASFALLGLGLMLLRRR